VVDDAVAVDEEDADVVVVDVDDAPAAAADAVVDIDAASARRETFVPDFVFDPFEILRQSYSDA
jgi:hypothetical protein